MNHDGNIRVLLENPKGSDFRWIAIVVLDDPPKKKTIPKRFDHGFVGGRALANL